MNLRTLPDQMDLRDQRVLVRVDWNVPLSVGVIHELPLPPSDTMKIAQTIPFLKSLVKRGATVLVFTHLGRPEKREAKYSTEQLAAYVSNTFGLKMMFHRESVSRPLELKRLQEVLRSSPKGFIHVLENTRFEQGEKKNDPKLAAAYASLARLYVNNAFASCHDADVSIVGVTKLLPSYAGPDLEREVSALSRLIQSPAHPFVAIVGGIKLDTKLPLITYLLKTCDAVLLGSGYVMAESSIFRSKHLILPSDVVMLGKEIKDTSTKAIKAWEPIIKKAKTILWNGPIGDTREAAYAKGTHALIRLLASTKGYVVAGGGDTIPEIIKAKAYKKLNHVSMGGGAMLAFIAKKGNLPGLKPLFEK